MEVPAAILNNLQCSNCEACLSCVPILMNDDGEHLCGRCTAPEQGVRRNKPYEELAQLMKFPCKYEEYGCTQLLLFSLNKSHEDACEYRPYICPIAPSGKCEWIGRRVELLEHCQKDHGDQVVQNPCVLEHQILKTTLDTFLMSAFNLLFLIYTKVCVSTKKIYHAVRLIGDPALATNYECKLNIDRKGVTVSKSRRVAPQGCLALQENIALATRINGLIETLDGFDGTKFTLKIQMINEDMKQSQRIQNSLESEVKSGTNTPLEETDGEKRNCKYHKKGCIHNDSVSKIEKHELYFCQFAIRCPICAKNIAEVDLDAHYEKIHDNISYENGEKWTVLVSDFWKWCVVSTDFGNVLCNHWQDVKGFHVIHPKSKRKYVRKPHARFNRMADWFAEFAVDEFNSCLSDETCKVKVTFANAVLADD